MYLFLKICFSLLLIAAINPPAWADAMTGRHGKIHFEWSPAQPACHNQPTTILVHGFSTPMWAWTILYEALSSRGCPVLRFDLHGRGQSDLAKIDNLKTFHDQIDDLRLHLNIQSPVVLVGWSMGGTIVASYTHNFPERVNKLVLIAPFSQRKEIPLIKLPIWDWVVVKGWSRLEPKWSYRHNFANPDLFEQTMPHYVHMFQNVRLDTDMARSLLSSAREIISHDQMHHYKAVGQLEKPVLMLWGKQDEVLNYEEHQPLIQAMPQTEFVSIDQCGHIPHLERPDVFLPAVLNFLMPRQGIPAPKIEQQPGKVQFQ